MACSDKVSALQKGIIPLFFISLVLARSIQRKCPAGICAIMRQEGCHEFSRQSCITPGRRQLLIFSPAGAPLGEHSRPGSPKSPDSRASRGLKKGSRK